MNTDAVLALNHLVALGTIGMQALTLVLLFVFFFKKESLVAKLAGRWGMWVAFLLSLAGVAVSLVYSDYFGIIPCGLCWVQRVFLYPQVVLFALALWKKDRRIADYSIALSIFGAAVALYQHYLQMGGTSALPCPASGAGDCAKRFLFEFDYITFPLVAFSSFALLIVIMLFVRRHSVDK